MTADRQATVGAPAETAFVLSHTTLQPVSLVPEISLYLAGDAFAVWEETEQQAGGAEQPPPFWACAWPGGQAIARYLLDHPENVAGRRALDIGSGSGLVAIAAARAGASAVLASETDPLAHAAILLNAAANDVAVAVIGDVLDGHGGDAEVILAADVWYERRLAARAVGLLQRARARGADVVAGDIGRAFLPRPLLRQLAAYDVPVSAELEDAAVKRAMIFAVR